MSTVPRSVYRARPKTSPKSFGFSRYALDFDGRDNYVEVPSTFSYDAYTLLFWYERAENDPETTPGS